MKLTILLSKGYHDSTLINSLLELDIFRLIKIAVLDGDETFFRRLRDKLTGGLDRVSIQMTVTVSQADEYDLMLLADDDMDWAIRGLTAGVCVITDSTQYDERTWLSDFVQGWCANRSAGFFAKVFDPVIHIKTPTRVSLGLGSTINPRTIVLNSPDASGNDGFVRIGRASHLGADCLLNLGSTNFSVGSFTMISANFSAHAMRHSLSHVSNFCIRKGPFDFFGVVNDNEAPIEVGNDVWIGERVVALPGTTFADGCVIGAGSVVTRGTEPYGIYAGNPARLIRYRFSREKISFLRNVRWWDYPYDKLREIAESFRQPISELSIEQMAELF